MKLNNKSNPTAYCKFLPENKQVFIYYTDKSNKAKVEESFSEFIKETKWKVKDFEIDLSDQADKLVEKYKNEIINKIKSKYKVDCSIDILDEKAMIKLSGMKANIKDVKNKVKEFIKK